MKRLLTAAAMLTMTACSSNKTTVEDVIKSRDSIIHSFQHYMRDYQVELRNDSVFIYNGPVLIGSNKADKDCWILQVIIKSEE